MHELFTFDYAIIRVVPLVDREEFLNAGAIVSCPAKQFLDARIELDLRRLHQFAPCVDPQTIEAYLLTIPLICAGGAKAGPIGQLPQRARFHWLVAPRSTIIQTSPVHSGLCADPEGSLVHLVETMVIPPRSIKVGDRA
jgi:hypothetical protein